jgi:hypothetical protein
MNKHRKEVSNGITYRHLFKWQCVDRCKPHLLFVKHIWKLLGAHCTLRCWYARAAQRSGVFAAAQNVKTGKKT